MAGTLEHHQPAIVILELGGNDGLRGYPIDRIRQNLEAMIMAIQAADAHVLLVGMVLQYDQEYLMIKTAFFGNLTVHRLVQYSVQEQNRLQVLLL